MKYLQLLDNLGMNRLNLVFELVVDIQQISIHNIPNFKAGIQPHGTRELTYVHRNRRGFRIFR